MSLDLWSRRRFLRSAKIGGGALGVSHLASGFSRAIAEAASKPGGPSDGPRGACILLWMSGGPSQMETLDPKPDHANGGPTRSIATSVPGIHLAEHLPGVASRMDDIAIIRSMSTREGDHGRATRLMTGGHPVTGVGDTPHLGALLAHQLGRRRDREGLPGGDALPPHVSVLPTGFGEPGPGYLGPRFSPLVVGGGGSGGSSLTVEYLHSPNDPGTVRRRFELLEQLSRVSGATSGSSGGTVVPGGAGSIGTLPADDAAVAAFEANRRAAWRMIETGGGGAFDLDREPGVLRDAYGRTGFGQGCLLARRLVERGVRFVEVTLSATPASEATPASWDTHVDNFRSVGSLCRVLDPAWSTLVTDLRDRGMLDDTLVLWMGEFGRTPMINANGGRDHFPDAWSVAMAGGRVRGGQVVGRTSDDGTRVTDRPVNSRDLLATVLAAMGLDPGDEIDDGDRPRPVTADGARVIEELIG